MAEQAPSKSENPFSKFTGAHWAWVGGLTVVGIVAFHEAWYWSLLGSAGIVYGFTQSDNRVLDEKSTVAPTDASASTVGSNNDSATPTPLKPDGAPDDRIDIETPPAQQLHATWYDERGVPLSAPTVQRMQESSDVTLQLPKPTQTIEPAVASASTAEGRSIASWTAVSVVSAIVFYFAYSAVSPYWATYRLYKAVQRADTAALERVVAFDDLRANLKRRLPGDTSAVAIDAFVTPSAVMAAIGNRPADSDDDRSLLYFTFATGHRDGDYFVVANTVVFCRYGMRWRVCDLKGS